MVKQAKNLGADPRDLWLAGLGMVSLTRKQAAKTYGTLVQEGTQFRDAAAKRIDALDKQARANLGEVKARVEASVDPLLARATKAYGAVKSELEARLSPVVAAISKKPAKAKPVRKAAAGKAAAANKASASKAAASKSVPAKKAAKKTSAATRGTVKKAA